MIALSLLFLVLAAVCFFAGAVGKWGGFNWLCAGLFCLTLVVLTGGHL